MTMSGDRNYGSDSDPEIYPATSDSDDDVSDLESPEPQSDPKDIEPARSAEPDSVVSLFLLWIAICFTLGAVGLLNQPHLVFTERDLLGRVLVSGIGLIMFCLLLLWTLGIGAAALVLIERRHMRGFLKVGFTMIAAVGVALLPAAYLGLTFLPELVALIEGAVK